MEFKYILSILKAFAYIKKLKTNAIKKAFISK